MRYLELTDHVANAWLETFDYDLGFYAPESWDLFTGFCRTGCRPATRTEAQHYMRHAGTKKRIAFLKTAVPTSDRAPAPLRAGGPWLTRDAP